MNHTKLPWEYKEWEHGSYGDSVGYIAEKGGTPEETNFICHIDSKKDAKFIVRAVNSHYDLLEAANILYGAMKLSYAGSPGPVRTGILHINPELYSKLEKAIAKAKRKI